MSDLDNVRMKEYSSGELMAGILNLQEAMASGYDRLDRKIDGEIGSLRFDMNKRFDRMDERFDRLEGRVAALEPHGHSPAS